MGIDGLVYEYLLRHNLVHEFPDVFGVSCEDFGGRCELFVFHGFGVFIELDGVYSQCGDDSFSGEHVLHDRFLGCCATLHVDIVT